MLDLGSNTTVNGSCPKENIESGMTPGTDLKLIPLYHCVHPLYIPSHVGNPKNVNIDSLPSQNCVWVFLHSVIRKN